MDLSASPLLEQVLSTDLAEHLQTSCFDLTECAKQFDKRSWSWVLSPLSHCSWIIGLQTCEAELPDKHTHSRTVPTMVDASLFWKLVLHDWMHDITRHDHFGISICDESRVSLHPRMSLILGMTLWSATRSVRCVHVQTVWWTLWASMGASRWSARVTERIRWISSW